MNRKTSVGRSSRLAIAFLMTGISAWCVIKWMGWVAYYSAYFGEPGMQAVLSTAHRWAIIYAWAAMFLALGATLLAGIYFKRHDDRLAVVHYLLFALAVVSAIAICVVSVGLYGPVLSKGVRL